MMEPSDSSSESWNPAKEGRYGNGDELPITASVVIEDLTGETDELVGESDSFVAFNSSSGVPAIKPRSYQLEMFEERLNQNIIVAVRLLQCPSIAIPKLIFSKMDTGSGKTHM
jgi:hypothetical protein